MGYLGEYKFNLWILILPNTIETSLKQDNSIPVTLNQFPGADFPRIPGTVLMATAFQRSDECLSTSHLAIPDCTQSTQNPDSPTGPEQAFAIK